VGKYAAAQNLHEGPIFSVHKVIEETNDEVNAMDTVNQTNEKRDN